ncbi:hypothetical protein IVA95_28905 [Bradyrhizobium sp. 157]|nr:hypothetical protein [Bradyrhizobium sp. 157]
MARLCENHDIYRWLRGGVGVNYHGLADFRTMRPDLLDRLLSENVARVIELDEVAQDGVRAVRRGHESFPRRKKLHKELRKAQRSVQRPRQETTDSLHASNRRIMAAKECAARERETRVKTALAKMTEIEALRERRARPTRRVVECPKLDIEGSHRRHGRQLCLAEPSGQAPKPRSGAPQARGLTAKVRTMRSSSAP